MTPGTDNPSAGDAVLRAARALGRLLGVVSAFLPGPEATWRTVPNPGPLAAESSIRATAAELGISPDLPLHDLKVAIADALPRASDEALRRAVARLRGEVPWAGHVDAVTGILRTLGPP